MKAKEYLNGIRSLDNSINDKIDRLAELKARATKTTVAFGDERVQTSGSKDTMANATVEMVMLMQEINADIDRFVDYKNEAKRMIANVKNKKYQSILYWKYIKYKSLYWIAKRQGKDYENIKHLHGKALAKFEYQLQDVVVSVDITPKM